MADEYQTAVAVKIGEIAEKADELDREIGTSNKGHEQWAEEIWDAFGPFHGLPDPSKMNEAVGNMAAVSGEGIEDIEDHDVNNIGGVLQSAAEHYRKVDAKVESGWQGYAADSFRTYFGGYDTTLEVQSAAIHTLGMALASNQAILQEARKDTLEIAEQTLNALEEAIGGSSKTGKAQLALSIVIAVAGIAAMANPMTHTVAFTVLASGAISANGVIGAATGDDSEEDTGDIEGSTAEEIIDSMRGQLSKVQSNFRNGEDRITEVLNELAGAIEADMDAFSGPRPSTLTDTPENSHEEFEPKF